MSNFFGSPSESSIPASGLRVEFNALMRQVYLWMATGLLVTAAVAVGTATMPSLQRLALNPAVLIIAIIAELALVLILSFALKRLSPGVAIAMFFVYAALNGFTLSIIFLAYELPAIGAAFLTTAGLFGAMTVVGFTTKTDLSKYSTYFLMALIGLIIAGVINIFLQSSAFDFIISIAGVLIFTALTAYDTQRIKVMASDPTIQADGSLSMKLSIMGALRLYLDFINLFLFLLRLFGRRR
ncbi:MAG: Bax inhibitor-1/YccA family protein [Chloroflexota bacterium]